MRILFNILWHLPGMGFVLATIVFVLGFLLSATFVAAPIGLGLMEYGKFLFAPCTRVMIREDQLDAERLSERWKVWSRVVWVLYLPLGIILLMLTIIYIVESILLIYGILNAYVMAKSLGVIINPTNRKCVSYLIAEEVERRRAASSLDEMRSQTTERRPGEQDIAHEKRVVSTDGPFSAADGKYILVYTEQNGNTESVSFDDVVEALKFKQILERDKVT